MSQTINPITGGYGILVSRMAGQYIIELDTSNLSNAGSNDAPLGILDLTTSAQLTYDTSHDTTANTNTWHINDDNNTGMKMTVQTATVYDPAGDRILYSMVRDMTFNSLGQLVEVSAERRITVDTTEVCI
ncbi:hypothetical protein JYU15_02275 [bacterium AH-315-I18]|nr:hypothetical protein [bacterium AH-315-I18]